MSYVTIVVAAIVCLGVVTALLHFFSKGEDQPVAAPPSCATCDGTDSRCEQECMLEAAVKDIEYFDDEELDRFQGREGNAYSDEEAEEFREVLLTMRESEVKDWSRSLTLRGIQVPDQVKDEFLMLLDN